MPHHEPMSAPTPQMEAAIDRLWAQMDVRGRRALDVQERQRFMNALGLLEIKWNSSGAPPEIGGALMKKDQFREMVLQLPSAVQTNILSLDAESVGLDYDLEVAARRVLFKFFQPQPDTIQAAGFKQFAEAVGLHVAWDLAPEGAFAVDFSHYSALLSRVRVTRVTRAEAVSGLRLLWDWVHDSRPEVPHALYVQFMQRLDVLLANRNGPPKSFEDVLRFIDKMPDSCQTILLGAGVVCLSPCAGPVGAQHAGWPAGSSAAERSCWLHGRLKTIQTCSNTP